MSDTASPTHPDRTSLASVASPVLPAILRDVFAERRVFNPRGEAVELSSNVSSEEAALLRAAVSELQPRASVEIGFAQGVSTLAILDALRANGRGHHHVVDPFQSRYYNCGRAMVERAGLASHYTFYERFPEEIIPGLPSLQFAFIDSSHLFDLTICEFVLVDRKLAVGGVVGFHDMWMESQQAFVRYVLANRAYEVWRPKSGDEPVGDRRDAAWKRLLRTALTRLPGAPRIFAREFLKPWQDYNLGNLVLLRKVAEDDRDWRFHRRF